jgi:hypothetical protein
MPLQNRVTPLGDIVATHHRGTMMGNRGGCFHRDDKTLKARPWANRQWLCCVLSFKARRRQLMQPGLYTELFFLDEATALAAGHRPCFECRRADAQLFQRLWAETVGRGILPKAAEMDVVLHAERLLPVAARSRALAADLPDGAFVLVETTPHLVLAGALRPWSFDGYGRPHRAAGLLTILTPPAGLAILRAGYRPTLHPTITTASGDHA